MISKIFTTFTLSVNIFPNKHRASHYKCDTGATRNVMSLRVLLKLFPECADAQNHPTSLNPIQRRLTTLSTVAYKCPSSELMTAQLHRPPQVNEVSCTMSIPSGILQTCSVLQLWDSLIVQTQCCPDAVQLKSKAKFR